MISTIIELAAENSDIDYMGLSELFMEENITISFRYHVWEKLKTYAASNQEPPTLKDVESMFKDRFFEQLKEDVLKRYNITDRQIISLYDSIFNKTASKEAQRRRTFATIEDNEEKLWCFDEKEIKSVDDIIEGMQKLMFYHFFDSDITDCNFVSFDKDTDEKFIDIDKADPEQLEDLKNKFELYNALMEKYPHFKTTDPELLDDYILIRDTIKEFENRGKE